MPKAFADLFSSIKYPQQQPKSPLADYTGGSKSPLLPLPLNGYLPNITPATTKPTGNIKITPLLPLIKIRSSMEEKTVPVGPIIKTSRSRIEGLLKAKYDLTLARILPSTNTLPYDNPRFLRNSWVLNIDLRSSSLIAENFPQHYPKIIQCFINEMTEIARTHGGAVGNFLGDGLTAIFVGRSDRTSSNRAVETAITMNTVTRIISQSVYPVIKSQIKCGIGISFGDFWIMRAGAKNTSESTRIWAGKPVNEASKFAENANGEIILSYDTYQKLQDTQSVAKHKWNTRLPVPLLPKLTVIYAADLIYPNY